MQFGSRDTRECECESRVEMATATMARKMPGRGGSCDWDRAGSARSCTGCPCRASDETPASVVCVSEARVSDRPCVGCGRKTVCVRSLYTREMSVAMCEHAAASPGVRMNGNEIVCSLGLVARGSVSARREWRRKLRLWRNKCRVAAVVSIGTGPGPHGSERVVRAVPRTRPPRAWLRGLRPGPETHAVSS